MRLLSSIALCLVLVCGCSTSSSYRPSDSHDALDFNYEKATVTIKNDEVTWGMIEGIIEARGGKEPGDLWEVDLTDNGDVRIWKHPTDGSIYPPGAAIEFWYIGDDGGWHARLTA